MLPDGAVFSPSEPFPPPNLILRVSPALVLRPRCFRPFLSANLNAIPRALYSAATSSKVFPWVAASLRILRVRTSQIK